MKVGLRTDTKMKWRFFDRDVVSHLQPVTRRLLTRVGAAVRMTAKRSLRPAPQRPLNDLTAAEAGFYLRWVQDYKAGRIGIKPRRPEKTAPEGVIPLLHTKPKSPLRELIYFAFEPRTQSVVIGPERSRSLSLENLEDSNPFMAPAFAKIKPRIPQYLKQASR